jgi:hypothetical protein
MNIAVIKLDLGTCLGVANTSELADCALLFAVAIVLPRGPGDHARH